MNMYVSFSLFSLMILIYWVISEVFTMLYRITGLPDEKARFQVVSLLTGCGFTTRESEMILSTKERRNLARMTMLFGYVFNISIVSVLINVILSLKESQAGEFLHALFIPLIPLVIILVGMRATRMRAWSDARLERAINSFMNRNNTNNTVLILDYIGQDSIALVHLKNVPERFRGRDLAQMDFRDKQGLIVLLVEHPSGDIETPRGYTMFQDGDKVTVFGKNRAIAKTFNVKEKFSD